LIGATLQGRFRPGAIGVAALELGMEVGEALPVRAACEGVGALLERAKLESA